MKSKTVVVAVLLLAPVGSSARVDDPAPTHGNDPAEVLDHAGLALDGDSYVLLGEVEAIEIEKVAAQAQQRIAANTQKYQQVQADASAKDAEADRKRKKVERKGEEGKYEETRDSEDLRRQADNLRRQLPGIEQAVLEDQAECTRLQLRYQEILNVIMPRYAELADTPEIQQALREINKGRHPKVALGPISAYGQNVVRTMGDILSLIGYRREGDLCWLSEEPEIIKQSRKATLLWHELAMHERQLATAASGQPAPSQAAARAQLGTGNAVTATSPPTAGPASTGATATGRGTSSAPAHTRAEIARKRLELVQLVRKVRTAVRDHDQHLSTLRDEGEAQDCVEMINRAVATKRHSLHLGPKPGYKRAIEDLAGIEAAIHPETITLKRDADRFCVDVRIQDHVVNGMLVDPESAWVELPETLAIELVVKPRETTFALRRHDGTTVQARRALLRRLEVGRASVENVSCAVLPADMADARPVLGGAFLNRFAVELEKEQARLTLTRVDQPPAPTKPIPQPAASQ